MKRKLTLISCVITMLITLVFLLYLTGLMEYKESDKKYADFWKQDVDFDVMFLGSSHVINAIFPMELWNDYGIVSYNLGGHGNRIPTSYWVMKNAINKTIPKIVVIDCFDVESDFKTYEWFSYLHLSFDSFPISISKIKAVFDLLNDSILDAYLVENNITFDEEKRSKIGLLWNYSVYHSRWDSLDAGDFVLQETYEKGAEARNSVKKGSLKQTDYKKMDIHSVGEEYLRKIIEDCQALGIDVVLTYLPFEAEEEQQNIAYSISDIAIEYDVPYINFFDSNIINYSTDLYTDRLHLNSSGARKITNYIGSFLVDCYNLPNHLEDKKYSFWQDDYAEYIEKKNRDIQQTEDLATYLSLLAGDDVDIVIEINKKDILENEWGVELINNLCDNSNVTIIDSGEGTADIEFEVSRNGKMIDSVGFAYIYNKAEDIIETIKVMRC